MSDLKTATSSRRARCGQASTDDATPAPPRVVCSAFVRPLICLVVGHVFWTSSVLAMMVKDIQSHSHQHSNAHSPSRSVHVTRQPVADHDAGRYGKIYGDLTSESSRLILDHAHTSTAFVPPVVPETRPHVVEANTPTNSSAQLSLPGFVLLGVIIQLLLMAVTWPAWAQADGPRFLWLNMRDSTIAVLLALFLEPSVLSLEALAQDFVTWTNKAIS